MIGCRSVWDIKTSLTKMIGCRFVLDIKTNQALHFFSFFPYLFNRHLLFLQLKGNPYCKGIVKQLHETNVASIDTLYDLGVFVQKLHMMPEQNCARAKNRLSML